MRERERRWVGLERAGPREKKEEWADWASREKKVFFNKHLLNKSFFLNSKQDLNSGVTLPEAGGSDARGGSWAPG